MHRWLCRLAFFLSLPGWAHELVGEGSSVQPLRVITIPTAGLLPQGSLLLQVGLFPAGTLSAECFASPIPRLLLGLAFSGRNLIGTGEPEWQSLPGVSLRFRLRDEGMMIPAVVLGLHTQGWGGYEQERRRFTIPAAGIFLAASKSYRWWLGELAWHGMLGYPLEPPPRARRINAGIGFEHTLGRFGRIVAEYNFLRGDAERKGRTGMLSVAFSFGIGRQAALCAEIVDIVPPQESEHPWARALTILYYLR